MRRLPGFVAVTAALAGGAAVTVAAFFMAVGLVAEAPETAYAQSAKTTLRDPVLAQRFNDISDRLVCQCGCNEVLRVCSHTNCESAIPMRHSIEKQLKAGKTDDEIVQSFVDKYGLKVLSAPPAKGIDLAAWVMPGFALLIGLLIIVSLARQWVSRRRLATADQGPPDIDPEIQARIEAELKEREI